MSYYDYQEGEYSDCCGAVIIYSDICSDCKEHCGIQEDDEIFPGTKAQLDKLTITNVITSYSIHYTKLYDCFPYFCYIHTHTMSP